MNDGLVHWDTPAEHGIARTARMTQGQTNFEPRSDALGTPSRGHADRADADPAIPETGDIPLAGPNVSPDTPITPIAPGEWVMRCTECSLTRPTSSLGVRVNRRRVFNARTTAMCPGCGWMRPHVVERFEGR